MMATALASPTPLYAMRSASDFLPSVLRLSLQSCSTSFISSTAVILGVPEPMSMASSSALVSAAAPCAMSFSRGRSSKAQSVMRILPSIVMRRNSC